LAEKIKGISIEVGGDTTGFQKALKGLNSEVNKTQKELAAVDVALKLDPKNTELLTQKQQLLTKATDDTKVKLKALKDAKAQADEDMANGTKVNEEQYRKLQREIAFTESNVKKLETETKEFTKTANKAGKEIDLFGDKTEKLNSAANKVGAVALAGATAIGGMALKAAQSADDINTMAKVTGLSTEEIQKFQYASERIDVSLDTLTGSMSKLTKNMAIATSGTGDTYEAFQKLGVEFTNQDGSLRDKQEVFNEVIAKLGEMSNETERDAIAMQLMGKSAQDLNPLILGGADALTQYGQEAENAGLILSQDALDGANAFNDGIDKLKATVAAGVGKMGGAFAKDLVPAIEKAVGVIEKIIGFIAENKSVIITLIAILGTLALGIKAVIAVQTILNLVMAANPILLIVVAVAALVAGLIALWNNCEGFRNYILNAIDVIKGTVAVVIKFISDRVSEAQAGFKVVCDAIGEFFTNLWNGIKSTFESVINWIVQRMQDNYNSFTGFFGAIGDFFMSIFDKIKGIFSSIGDTIKNTFDGVLNAVKGPLNGIIGFINNAIDGVNSLIGGINSIKIDVPDWVPVIGGQQFGFNVPTIPKIPMLANGGILSSGQAIVAEAGPELIQLINGKAVVTPLSKGATNTPAGRQPININLYGTGVTAQQVAQIIRNELGGVNFKYINENGKSIVFGDSLPCFFVGINDSIGKNSITGSAIGGDGQITLSETLNPRNIVCEFLFKYYGTAESYRRAWMNIQAVLNPLLKGTIEYTTDAGAFAIDVKPLETPVLDNQRFSVQFVADYPYWRDATATKYRFGTIINGLQLPSSFDEHIIFGEWTKSFTFYNDTETPTPFELEIESVSDYCKLTNDKGEFIKVDRPITQGQKLIINTGTYTTKLVDVNGAESYANNKLTLDSTPDMKLYSGTNILTFDNGLQSLPAATIKINRLYVGIK